MRKTSDKKLFSRGNICLALCALCCSLIPGLSPAQVPGVMGKTIVVGSLLPLEGDLHENGLALKAGLETALATQSVQGRRVELKAVNDFYDPAKTVEGAKQLVKDGIFLMIGSYGSPTLQAALPILAQNNIPMLAPFTGAALSSPGDVLNMRASYAQEVAGVINIALTAGVKPEEICAYVQNDAYGMSNLDGIRTALANVAGATDIVAKLGEIIKQPGDNPRRDNIGPVGVYSRDTLTAYSGYLSLKQWEKNTKSHCRLVVTAGVFDSLANFIHYARTKGEAWVFSLNSSSSALSKRFQELNITGKVILTEVMPSLDANLPVVEEARKALGSGLNYASLEGYMAGKLFLAIARTVEGPLTQDSFLKAARRQPYDLGGFKVDFTNQKNPGSDLVFLSYLKDNSAFVAAKPGDLETLFK